MSRDLTAAAVGNLNETLQEALNELKALKIKVDKLEKITETINNKKAKPDCNYEYITYPVTFNKDIKTNTFILNIDFSNPVCKSISKESFDPKLDSCKNYKSFEDLYSFFNVSSSNGSFNFNAYRKEFVFTGFSTSLSDSGKVNLWFTTIRLL